MFYDLNVPWSPNDGELSTTLNFLHELGYNVVALNHSITGKLPNELVSCLLDFFLEPNAEPFNQSCVIPDPLPHAVTDLPPKLEIRRRVTLTLTDTLQNARLNALASHYDVLALRPIDERTLQLACGSYDCDIISLDLSQRFGFPFRLKTFSEAVKAGKRVEVCYAQGLLGDASARRNLISNATQLIRATRGRGLIISSEARSALACRGPWDVINLAAIWGLGQERGHEALAKEARGVVVRAQLKRTSFRGVVNVVYGGEKPAPEKKAEGKGPNTKGRAQPVANGQKRKAETLGDGKAAGDVGEKALSNTQRKKRARLQKLEAEAALKQPETDAQQAADG